MATAHHACHHIAARMASPRGRLAAPWTAPSLSDLIARIEDALGGRRPA
ncbi:MULTISPECIES: hypothetical protein [unclassified Sphingomonas]|jgi:hypothetical protein|nr:MULTISPECIES: hypothetical protein [unclassified Sphingomonas]